MIWKQGVWFSDGRSGLLFLSLNGSGSDSIRCAGFSYLVEYLVHGWMDERGLVEPGGIRLQVCYKEKPSSNTVAIADAVSAGMKRLEKTFPPGWN
jgi:hypothetical protein